jgi:hypothetical protein
VLYQTSNQTMKPVHTRAAADSAKPFEKGDLVELDGLLAVVVGTFEDGMAPEDHLALWFGTPQGRRKSEGGSGGLRAEVSTVPAAYCQHAAAPLIEH